jgi:hypothetical protein
MKVAFLVLNHRGPTQLVRLLTTMRSQLPDSPIVVHHDITHVELPAELIEPIGNVHLLTSGKPVTWGDFSLVDVCSWSLTWMREHLEFDWVVLLSAQDYPIKPLAGLGDDLAMNGADAVVGATPIGQLPLVMRMLLHRRYYFHYRPPRADVATRLPHSALDVIHRNSWAPIQVLNIIQPVFKIYRLTGRSPYRFGWRARHTPFTRNRPCWHASQWFALSRSALEYVLGYIAENPEYVNHYRRTMVPDESMFATIVCNSPDLIVANRDVTYTRWANLRTPHPDIFQAADFDELVAAPQYFARKFDIGVDTGILDALDKFIGKDAYRPTAY